MHKYTIFKKMCTHIFFFYFILIIIFRYITVLHQNFAQNHLIETKDLSLLSNSEYILASIILPYHQNLSIPY